VPVNPRGHWDTRTPAGNAGLAGAQEKGTKSRRPFGRPRIDSGTEAGVRAALRAGDMGMRKITVQAGVGTGTAQRIKQSSRRSHSVSRTGVMKLVKCNLAELRLAQYNEVARLEF